jgi:hypothetical protein
MKRYTYESDGIMILEEEDANPVCGVDFCDNCGDCLACYGNEPCVYGEHHWVKYEED